MKKQMVRLGGVKNAHDLKTQSAKDVNIGLVPRTSPGHGMKWRRNSSKTP